MCAREIQEKEKLQPGGIVTVKDSTDNWYLSWTINRQPQFKAQDKNTVLIWVYSLSTNKEGNYVKKAMRDCTGEEVCREWLYHIGVPTDKIDDWAKNRCNTTTCFMPYINAFFQPRKEEDRPLVVPKGSCKLCICWSVRRNSKRYHFYNRVLYQNRYGSGIYTS